MNSVNKSTGYTPFQLRFGRAPRVLPPLLPPPPTTSTEYVTAHAVIEEVAANVASAKDNLMLAKITQSFHSNPSRGDPVTYNVGDKVMLSTLNRRKEYKSQDQLHVAKFMPRYDGPYLVVDTHDAASTVTLDIFPTPPTSSPPSTLPTSNLSNKMMTSNILPVPWKNLDLSAAKIPKSFSWTRSSITRKSASLTSSTWFGGSAMALKTTNGFRVMT